MLNEFSSNIFSKLNLKLTKDNNMFFDEDTPIIYQKIISDNYLSNCYVHLTKKKIIHFLFLLIEILLTIFQELEVFIRSFQLENINNNNFDLNIVSFISLRFNRISTIIKLIVLILFIIIFD